MKHETDTGDDKGHFLPQDSGENGTASHIEYAGMEDEEDFETRAGKKIIEVKGHWWLRAYCGHQCKCNDSD